MTALPRQLGLVTATLVVVASMIGVGVFTTTGFLVRDVGSPEVILLGWAIGGVVSLAGALCYAELGAAYPENGGEYLLLSRVYHPAVGFVAGWVSLVVGFSAPAAAAALAFGKYARTVVPSVSPIAAAVALVLAVALIHAFRVRLGSWAQNAVTVTQVVLIGVFVVGGVLYGDPARLAGSGGLLQATLSPAFAVGLIYIAFAYSGWNAAAYIAGELEEPGRTLPHALVLGTAIVALLYLGLNAVFLLSAPAPVLSGVEEVGHVAAVHLFGESAGKGLSIIIALGLAASASAMVMTGPRVYEAMGRDYPLLGFLARRPERGGPVWSIALQTVLALFMVATASFNTLITYIGFTLSLFAGLTAVGVVVSRWRSPDLHRPWRTWGYPVTPLLFGTVTLWVVGHVLWERPVAAFFGLGTLALGLGLYFLVRHSGGRTDEA
ncbi:MAG: amino acid permease [Deltaproteobacteria bacterium]|nr:amino acid permease [Deltaproteobacteria bacterium]